MTELFEQRFQALQRWAEQARSAGWLEREDLASLAVIERQQAEALFARQGERPLVVAFFGGTGVGKSSLLNRLAGAAVARVGVERPTSQEVTLYLHEDYRLEALPDELPLEETRIAYHSDARRRLLAWLDMPDFDSVEARHRELVQAWLPYVDWVVYVVSPERYQDDIGWRFVQQRGTRHAWLFVMNHWDQGDETQIAHLQGRLEDEGFVEPLILRTSCRAGSGVEDQFPLLEQTLNRAIEAYGLKLLQQIGLQARMQELQRAGQGLLARVQGYPLENIAAEWQRIVDQGSDEIGDELAVGSKLFAQGLAPEPSTSWLQRLTVKPGLPSQQPETMLEAIWTQRVDTRLHDFANELEGFLRAVEVPTRPFQPLRDWSEGGARQRFMQAAERGCAQALLRPGTRLKRAVLRLLNWTGWLLPLSAAGWVGYHLVTGFYQGTQGSGPFLGIDYAIHSALLVLLAWLLPWLLQRRLQPGVAEVVEGALSAGIVAGLAALRVEGVQKLQDVVERRDQCTARYPSQDKVSTALEAVDPRALSLG